MKIKNVKNLALVGLFLAGGLGCASSRTARIVSEPSAGDGAAGPYLYVANQEAAAVTVIDLETHEIVEVIDLEAMGYGANAKPPWKCLKPMILKPPKGRFSPMRTTW